METAEAPRIRDGAPSADAGPRAPALQVGQALVTAAPAGRLELRLEPVELGAVEIVFDFRDDTLRATVTSERASTADLLRRHGDVLLQHLRDAGFDGAMLHFGDRRGSEPSPGGFGSGADRDAFGGPAASPAPDPSSAPRDGAATFVGGPGRFVPAGIDRRI